MALIDYVLDATASVEPWLRQGESGPVYGPQRQCRCRIDGPAARLSSSAREGWAPPAMAETTGHILMLCALEEAERISPGSRVTSGGRSWTVLEVRPVQAFIGEHTEVRMA